MLTSHAMPRPWTKDDPELVARRGDWRQVFRLLKSETYAPFYSDMHANRRPRGPQARNALIHAGLSAWLTKDAARRKNMDFDGQLGDTLLTLELDPDLGIWWASTFSPQHVTVWGRPDALGACVRAHEPA
jgi:hypothetical protein